mmetsp:Transcript_7407/g.10930  ORF Transcript_7407/g.10930 Transcript_7407/m.10930 type:complete len:172 (+) Transcript_7407:34-549(+)
MDESSLLERSNSLSQRVIPNFYFQVVMALIKLGVAILAGVALTFGTECGNSMHKFVLGSCISLGIEGGLFFVFWVFVNNPSNCLSPVTSAYCALIRGAHGIIESLFYTGWMIYGCVVYFKLNSCSQDLSFYDSVSLALLVYFMGGVFVSLCCYLCVILTCCANLSATTETA